MTEAGTEHTRWISRASVVVALAISIALAGCGDSSPPSTQPSHRSAAPCLSRRRAGRDRLPYRDRIRRQRRTPDGGERTQRPARVARRPGADYSGRVSSRVNRDCVQRSASVHGRARITPIPMAGAARSGVVGIRNPQRRDAQRRRYRGAGRYSRSCGRQRRRDFFGHASRLRQHCDHSSRRRLRNGLRPQRAQPGQRRRARHARTGNRRDRALRRIPPARIFTSKCGATTSPRTRSPICPSPRPPTESALPRPAAASIFDHRTRDCSATPVRWNQG